MTATLVLAQTMLVTKPSNLQTVLKLLPELKPHEQIEVRKRLDFLTQNNPFQAKKKSATEEWLETGVTTELMRRGVSFGHDWKGRMPKGYWQVSDHACKFLIEAVTVKAIPVRTTQLTSAEKYALGTVVARALADYLYKTPAFGMKVMLQNIDKIPQALDASFPGYVAAGMLGKLFKVRDQL